MKKALAIIGFVLILVAPATFAASDTGPPTGTMPTATAEVMVKSDLMLSFDIDVKVDAELTAGMSPTAANLIDPATLTLDVDETNIFYFWCIDAVMIESGVAELAPGARSATTPTTEVVAILI